MKITDERVEAGVRALYESMRERVAREVYRELYPGVIGTHDSERTEESDLAEADRAYLTWDNGNEGFAPGIVCRRVADRVLAVLPKPSSDVRERLIAAMDAGMEARQMAWTDYGVERDEGREGVRPHSDDWYRAEAILAGGI